MEIDGQREVLLWPGAIVSDGPRHGVFSTIAVVPAMVAAAAYVIWLLVDLLLLLCAFALVSLILLAIINAIRRCSRVPFGLSLVPTNIGVFALLGGAIIFFGTTLRGEFAELAPHLPAAWARLQTRLQNSPWVDSMHVPERELAPGGQTLVNAAPTALVPLGGALSGLAIVLIGGLYLTAQPSLYTSGLLRLFQTKARGLAAETLVAIAASLRNWFRGQTLSMVLVGVGIGLGLWLAGVPAAWAIGVRSLSNGCGAIS